MQILMHHIREALPDLKLKIAQQLQRYRVELGELGDQTNDSETYLVRADLRSWAHPVRACVRAHSLVERSTLGRHAQSNLLLSIITDFSSEFRTTLDGYSENLSSSELAGGP